MLDYPKYNKSLIEKHQQEILQTFVLELCVFITHSLNIVYIEVTDNIQ